MPLRGRGSAAVLLLVTLALGGCSDDTPPATPAGVRLAPHCPPVPRPKPLVTADLVNRIVSHADLPGWQAGDIGASAELPDGRLVWVFGDTVRSARLYPRVVANSMLVSSGRCVSQVRTQHDGPVVPDVGAHTVRWPMSVVALPRRSNGVRATQLVVLCSRIRRGTGGSFDFTFLGTTAAVFTVRDDRPPRLLGLVEVTPDDPSVTQVNWGAAANVSGRWFYVYGTRLTGVKGVFGRELYVARAPVSDPRDRRRWQFWGHGAWHSGTAAATAVLPAERGVSQTLSVDRVDGRFVAVSKRDGDVGDFVYTWTAAHPWGPWQPHRAVKAPAGFDTGDLKYAPLAHPEIRLASGRLLVSISRNTTSLQRLFDDPQVGRPYFVEVDRP
jgi:hypothetical protein